MPCLISRRLIFASLLATSVFHAGMAAAWKPKTHIYLAEDMLRDALDDGRVTIKDVDPATGKVVGDLGSFEVDAKVLRALRAAVRQFRAGVVGPDAFPDIVTGQTVIHPAAANAIDGGAAGSNAWLTHLWRRGFVDSNAVEVNAFTLGYLTHAAGDVFAHTFVNHYAGGEFTMTPDPSNAIKHLTFEGYVGKRTPQTIGAEATSVPTRAGICNRRKADDLGLEQDCSSGTVKRNLPVTGEDTSIVGVERFILDEMTVVAPGSVLEGKLYKGDGRDKSIPYIFSTLRNGLAREVSTYDATRMALLGPARLAFSVANGPQAEYKRAWIGDIDRGLAALPAFSQTMSKALVYNEHGTDVAGAKRAADAYAGSHLFSMLGAPDGAVMTAAAISAITERLLPPPLREAMAQLARAPVEMMVTAATGMTPQQIAGYLTYPERHFDDVMTTSRGASGGEVPHSIRLADFNRDTLKIADAAYNNPALTWRIEDMPAAFDTIQLSKIMLLSPAGFAGVKAALATRGATIAVPEANVMLGWIASLDHGNQWQGLDAGGSRPVFTRHGDAAYARLFMKVVGEKPVTSVVHGTPETPAEHPASPVDEVWPPLPPTPAKPTPADEVWPPLPLGGGSATGSAPPGSVTAPPPVATAPGSDLGGGEIMVDALWSARLDRFERRPNGELHVFMTIRNLLDYAQYASPGSFIPVVTNGDGEGFRSRGVFRASGEPTDFSPYVAARGEVRMRFVFAVPAGFGRVTTFTLEGDSSRRTNRPVAWPVPAK